MTSVPRRGGLLAARRDSLRLPTWDYRLPGPYFVTVCVDGHRHALKAPEDRDAVLKTIRQICLQYDVRLHNLAVAEDHAHLIVTLPEGRTVVLGDWIGFLKRFVSRRGGVLAARSLTRRGGLLTARPLKWQRSFYDHVIRGDADFTEKARYVDNHMFREPTTEWAEWH